MASFAALKKNPFRKEIFKEVQGNLFDFLKLNPMAKFKDKDLDGPLKYFKDESPDSQAQKKAQGFENQDAFKALNFEHEPKVQSESPRILGFPTSIERQAYLRYIRFHLKPNGILKVTAPKNRSFETINKEVSEYKDWVFKRHEEFEVIRKAAPPLFWKDGQAFPFLGQDYQLKLQVFESRNPMIQLDLDQLHYFYPQAWDDKSSTEKSALLKQGLLKFYKGKAALELSKRTRLWSEQMQLYPKSLSFRNQKTRWGSCSSQGKISLNWRLIAYSPELMEYIIIHELAHLKHANHSKKFWNLVAEHCPNFDLYRKQLRDKQFFADFLAPVSELYLENPILINDHNLPKEVEL